MNWDQTLLQSVNQGLAGPLMDGLMLMVTTVSMPLLAMVPVLLLATRRTREGKALLVVVGVSTLAAVSIQFLLARPRPVGVRLLLPTPFFPSFPSGHAASAFGCLTFTALAGLRFRPPGLPRPGAARLLTGSVLASVVSLSRVYLGHHYPSDVLGGAVLGAAVGAVVYGCLYQRGGRRPHWSWLLWAQLAIVVLASLSAYLGFLSLAPLAMAGVDKVLHFTLFGWLAFLAVGWWSTWPAGWIVTAIGVLAIAEEACQGLSAARSFDWLDMAATLSGMALLGMLGTAARRRGVPTAGRGAVGAIEGPQTARSGPPALVRDE